MSLKQSEVKFKQEEICYGITQNKNFVLSSLSWYIF